MTIVDSRRDTEIVALFSSIYVENILSEFIGPGVEEGESFVRFEGTIGCSSVDTIGKNNGSFPSAGVPGAMTEELVEKGLGISLVLPPIRLHKTYQMRLSQLVAGRNEGGSRTQTELVRRETSTRTQVAPAVDGLKGVGVLCEDNSSEGSALEYLQRKSRSGSSHSTQSVPPEERKDSGRYSLWGIILPVLFE